MAFANIWLALRADANTIVRNYLSHDEAVDGEYTGPVVDRAGRFFRYMADQEVVSHLFRVPNVSGNDYHLYSISFSNDDYTLGQIRDEIDWVVTTYPTQVFILGAWKWTGEQYGTEHVYTTATESVTYSRLNPDYQPDDQEPNYDPVRVIRVTEDQEVTRITGMTGTPIYPIHARTIDFMPDVDDVGTRPTELSDVNLLAGQAPRSFF